MNAFLKQWGLCAGLALGWMTAVEAAPPSVPVRSAVGGGAQTPVIAVSGPYWGPGGDMSSGMRVGSPYYWSNGSGAGYGGGSMGYGMPGGYGAAGYGGAGYGDAGYGAQSYGGAGYGAGSGGLSASDAYLYHFGPGYHRSNDYAHFRFPYYSYRRPWYFPGNTSYNRDTNFPW